MPWSLTNRLASWAGLGRSFNFLDSPSLIDRELLLVEPSPQWVSDYVAACEHPMSLGQADGLIRPTRQQINDFVRVCPRGRQLPDSSSGSLPCYHFWMALPDGAPLKMAGAISLRIGHTYDTEMYFGHIGYHVYPVVRGHNYAERACRLIMPLAFHHGMRSVWITCNPDNWASRRTCERLGAQLVEIVPVPPEHELFHRGEIEKCRYRLDLPVAVPQAVAG